MMLTRLVSVESIVLLSLLFGGQTLAFAPPQASRHAASAQSKHLRSSGSNGNGATTTTTELSAIRRRAAFSWFKKALMAGVGLSTASNIADAQAAAPEGDEAGKIVTMQVDNLDGEPGNTGTIKIQMQPSWAPRGVERFEVRADESRLFSGFLCW